MASPASLILSKTLRSMADVKIVELNKRRAKFQIKKETILREVTENDHHGYQQRLLKLLSAVQELDLTSTDADDISNITTFVEQSIHDPSISVSALEGYEKWLRKQLDIESRRLDYAKLYSAIVTDHLRPRQDPDKLPTQEPSSLDGSFELLEKDRLQQLRLKFEKVVFHPAETDEVEIDLYLSSFFQDDESAQALERLREYIQSQSNLLYSKVNPFDRFTLSWVIKGLLAIDSIKQEKKNLLKAFQKDDVVLDEICDVLNMRWADLDNWQWTEDGSGLDVEPRRLLNSKFRVFIDEDLMQAMLTHYIGTSFCITLKSAMRYHVWPLLSKSTPIPDTDLDRRNFYLRHREKAGPNSGLRENVNQNFFRTFFLNQLPDDVNEEIGAYDEEDDEANSTRKSWTEIKQQLLRHLTTEFLIRKRLYGDAAIVQSDLQWFATSIPHSTLYAILRFVGVPDKWIMFWRKYLEVPLNMSKSAGELQEVKIRKRGIPMAQSTEKFLGELILIFMDVAVKTEGNMLLYRLHDDLFLSGPTQDCVNAWKAIQGFVRVMGLEINQNKTGSVYFGGPRDLPVLLPNGSVSMDFLTLTANEGWKIDDVRVNAHVRQLRIQLDQCDSILSFIQTYNSCIGRFFGHTFGHPANCLGLQHVESVLKAHARMQKELFGEGGVTETLREMLNRLSQKVLSPNTNFSVVDSFIFAPSELGGLGVVNPFVSLMLARPNVSSDPEWRIEDFITSEKVRYKQARDHFEESSLKSKKKSLKEIYGNDSDSRAMVNFDEFMSYEEFIKYRQVVDPYFRDLYSDLMSQAYTADIRTTPEVRMELLWTGRGSFKVEFSNLTSEKKYIVQMYAEEILRTFGQFDMVDKGLVPGGVMQGIMSEKTTWQMVL